MVEWAMFDRCLWLKAKRLVVTWVGMVVGHVSESPTAEILILADPG